MSVETISARPSLGFVGLGAMGGPMVRNLLRAGYWVRTFDRQRERLTRWRRDGMEDTTSPARTPQGHSSRSAEG
jgi:3-hydroxyisobutyrate dehydrogenase-like beta-hydroxyacid dehydrogenase